MYRVNLLVSAGVCKLILKTFTHRTVPSLVMLRSELSLSKHTLQGQFCSIVVGSNTVTVESVYNL